MSSKGAIYPGSFDPVTFGHVDLIERMSQIFQPFIVLAAHSSQKKTFFSKEERVSFLKESLKNIKNVEVDSDTGLLVNYARRRGVRVLVRGVRLVSDFEYELALLNTHKSLDPDIEALIAFTQSKYLHHSSKMVKEVAQHGGGVSGFVPECVAQAFREKYALKKGSKT